MQIHRFKILLLALICFFLSRVVWAYSVVQTEYEMLLPRSFQQNLIEQQWEALQKEVFRLNMTIADQIYDTPDVKVLLSGMKLDVQSMLEKPRLGSEGESVTLRSRKLQGHLQIQAVNIDQWIEREIGGVIGRFRIQARCEGVVVGLKPGKAVLTLKLSPEFDGAMVRAHVDDADLTWTADAWEIQALQCSGAQGLDEIIKQEVLKLTADPKIVREQKEFLMQYVRDYVGAKALDLSKPRSLVTARSDIKMSMSVSDFSGSEEQARARGIFRVEFTRDKSGDVQNLRLKGAALKSAGPAVLRVPEEFVLAMAKQAYAGNSWTESVFSNEIPGFSALMNSRWSQWFVWRELMDFSKAAKFRFDIYSAKNISVSGSGLNYQVKAPLLVKMAAPVKEGLVPFMAFSVPLTSQVKLSLVNGQATARLSDIDMGLKEYWDPGYVAKYPTNKTFDGETLRRRILKAAEGKSLSYQIPAIPVSDEISLTVQRVQAQPSGDLMLFLNTSSRSAPVPK